VRSTNQVNLELLVLQKVLPDVYFSVQEYSIYGCYNAFMNIFTNVSTNQAAILGHTIIPDDQEMPEDMARFLIGIRLTEQDTKRMNERVAKVREGNLTPDEERERENQRLLLTTDYIVDETATLVQARIDHRTAVRFIDRIQASQLVQMLYLEPHHINEALTLFRNRPDKGWSVTDCTSFAAMQLKGLDTAFALDEHFRQAGFQVVP
jgi:predicted nucleic acid-binding protein